MGPRLRRRSRMPNSRVPSSAGRGPSTERGECGACGHSPSIPVALYRCQVPGRCQATRCVARVLPLSLYPLTANPALPAQLHSLMLDAAPIGSCHCAMDNYIPQSLCCITCCSHKPIFALSFCPHGIFRQTWTTILHCPCAETPAATTPLTPIYTVCAHLPLSEFR